MNLEEDELDGSYVEPDLFEDPTNSDCDSDSSGQKLDDTLTLIGLPPSPPDHSLLKNNISNKFKPKIMSTPTKKKSSSSKQKLTPKSAKMLPKRQSRHVGVWLKF